MNEINISEKQKTVLLAIGAATCGQVIVCLLLTMLHPAAGEIVQNVLIQIGVFITLCLFAALAVLFASVLAWNFKKGIRVEYTTTTRLLSAGAFTEPDISPDRLIMLRPGETDAEYAERVRAEISNACPHRWVVIVPYQYPSGMVYRNPDECNDFARDQPPFQTSEIQPGQIVFSQESYNDYVSFLNWFAFYFRDYANAVKLQLVPENEKSQTFLASLRAAVLSVLFVMLASGLFAQKSAQLRATDIANRIPESGQNIAFVFEKSDIYRTADGKKTYIDLLTSVPAFRDGGGGKLVAVMSGNRSVYKAEQTGDVATTEGRDKIMRGTSEVVEGPISFSLPDSAESAAMAERLRYESWKLSRSVQSSIRPWWVLAMDFYWEWFWLILIITGAGWLVSSASAREGFWEIHRYAKYIVLLWTLLSAVLFAINLILTAKWAGVNNFWLTILTLIFFGVGRWAVTALVPDFIPAKGNHTIQHGYGRDSDRPGLQAGNR